MSKNAIYLQQSRCQSKVFLLKNLAAIPGQRSRFISSLVFREPTSRAIEKDDKSRIQTNVYFHHISKISCVQCFRNSLQIYCGIVTLWLTDYTINLPSPESWIKASKSKLTILVFVLFTWWQVEFSQTFAFICFFKNSDFNFWAKIRLVKKSWVHKEKAVMNSLKSFVTFTNITARIFLYFQTFFL